MKSKRLAVFGTVAALGLAGCGGQAATSSSAPPSRAQGAGAGPDLGALAKELGVSEAKLQKAMRKTMPQGAPPAQGS